MDRECLGIVWGMKRFAMYLYGKLFTLQTDHRSPSVLECFENVRVPTLCMGFGRTEL